MSDLIDTTEMYLRTVYELEEEGIPPLRARIAERLGHSGPTVSQTVARMERDGLLTVTDNRRIKLSETGHQQARAVMRKHRLVERLLIDIIGLDWELVHDEACRWEHVVSTDVEKRLVKILGITDESPYGNPIPGLEELGVVGAEDIDPSQDGAQPLPEVMDGPEVVDGGERQVRVVRMAESLQSEHDLLQTLHTCGIAPGVTVTVRPGGLGILLSTSEGAECELATDAAAHLYVVAE